jgi:hypothetical protein
MGELERRIAEHWEAIPDHGTPLARRRRRMRHDDRATRSSQVQRPVDSGWSPLPVGPSLIGQGRPMSTAPGSVVGLHGPGFGYGTFGPTPQP